MGIIAAGTAFPHRAGRRTRISPDEAETLVFVLACDGSCAIDHLGRSFADGELSYARCCANGTRRVGRLVDLGMIARPMGSRTLWLTEPGRIAAALALAKDETLRLAYFDSWPE